MPDAPVQAAPIDPNLLVNASHIGAADAFNYGPGQQQLRNAQTRQTILATDFNYGTGAYEARTKEVNYNYGPGALDQQKARTEGLNALTAAQILNNETSTFDLNNRRLEEEQVGKFARENRGLTQQKDLVENQQTNLVYQSDAGKRHFATLAQKNLAIEANKTELSAKNIESDLKMADLGHQTEYSKALIQDAVVNREREKVFNRQGIIKGLSDAQQADEYLKQNTGSMNPVRQTEYLQGLLKSNYQGVSDSIDVIEPIVNTLSQTYGLPPELRTSIDSVKSAVAYHSSGKAIQGTMSGLAAARDAGSISEAGSNLLGRSASIGLNPRDDTDMLRMSVEKVGDTYTLKNNGNNRVSKPYSQDEFDGSPELQALFVASEKRKANRQNTLTASDLTTQKLLDIQGTPLSGAIGERFGAVINALGPQIVDKDQFIAQSTQTFSKVQKDLAASNPFYGPEGNRLIAQLHLGESKLGETIRGVYEPVTDAVGITGDDTFGDLIKQDPNLASTLVEAYKNRATMGLSPSAYNDWVEELAKNVESSDPRYTVGGANSPAAVSDRKRLLRSTIQRNLHIPTNTRMLEKAYQNVVKVYPGLALADTGPNAVIKPLTLVGRIKDSLRRNVIGYSKESLTDDSTVPQSATNPQYPAQ